MPQSETEIKLQYINGRAKLIDSIAQVVDRNNDYEIQFCMAVMQDKANEYASISLDSPNSISYAPEGVNKYDSKRRRITKLGRWVHRISRDYIKNENDRTKLAYRIAAKLFPNINAFKVLRGQKIIDAYCGKFQISGSCMNGKSDVLELYAINPDKIGLLTYDDGAYIARAILWTTDKGNTLCDRIYPNDGPHIEAYKNYCNENNIFIRSTNSQSEYNKFYHGTKFIEYDYVELAIPDSELMPYMDSFCFSDEYDGSTAILYSCSDSSKRPYDYSELLDTDGGGLTDSPRVRCGCCENRVSDDDVYIIYNGDSICSDCINNEYVMCERSGEYYHIDDCSEVMEGYWLYDSYVTVCSYSGVNYDSQSEELLTLENGDIVHMDHAAHCEHCETWHLADDMQEHELVNYLVCPDCYEELEEKRQESLKMETE